MIRDRINAWLALFRLPNLFTAPGDPLAGALLAGAATGTAVAPQPAALAAAASLCLYACGLVANDVLGAGEDARERPDRPIPSGRISRPAALAVAVLLNGVGLACAARIGSAALAVAVLLSLCVWVYNLKARTIPRVRPVVMGACRGLSLLLGAAALGPAGLGTPAPLIAAAGVMLAVAALTAIARREVGPDGGSRICPGLLASLPVALLVMLGVLNTVAWVGWAPVLAIPPLGFPLLLAGMAVVWAALWCGLLFGQPDPAAVRTSIGALVRGLMLVQAALCGVAGLSGEVVALGLLAAFVVSSWVGHWIKGS
jgi:4-hydroxybenzoate polyprenyltransferase